MQGKVKYGVDFNVGIIEISCTAECDYTYNSFKGNYEIAPEEDLKTGDIELSDFVYYVDGEEVSKGIAEKEYKVYQQARIEEGLVGTLKDLAEAHALAMLDDEITNDIR